MRGKSRDPSPGANREGSSAGGKIKAGWGELALIGIDLHGPRKKLYLWVHILKKASLSGRIG